jgi:LPS-assembly protein
MVYDGTVTTCELPHPRWQFNANKVVVNVGGTAKIYHSVFGIKGIPVLYFPFATLPAQRFPRQSGFLIPNIGTSSVKGTILGESLFWAINRSMDAHIGAEYFSARGWAPQAEFRAQPGANSFLDLNYYQVLDRGVGNPTVNQVKSKAFLSNTTDGFFYNVSTQRYQDFESTTAGDVVTILHAPSFEVSSVDRQLGPSSFYWSYEAAAEGLSRSEPGFSTAALVGRFDFEPTVSLPLKLDGWSFRPEFSLRDTEYTQQLGTSSSGARVAESDPINRWAVEGSVEVRPPALSRIFDREFMGRKWKHVVEPRVVYSYVTGVNNFPNILRFDERDILTNTNEVEYGVVNRLYTKRATRQSEDCEKPGMPALFIGGAPVPNRIPWQRQGETAEAACKTEPQVREVVTWELTQKYFIDPTFGGALVTGQSNVFTSTADLTGTTFLTSPRHLSPLISRLRIQTSDRTDIEWDVDYDFVRGGLNASTILANYRFGQFTLGGGDAYLQAPGECAIATCMFNTTTDPNIFFWPQLFNQFRLLLGYGHTGKQGFSVATNVGFDAKLGFVQYAAAQTTYNWDCCGISLEFRRFALGEVRNENQYRFTFALANLGALGNLRRTERLF